MNGTNEAAAGPGVLVFSRDSHTPQRPPKKPRESRAKRRERLARLEHEPVPQLFQEKPKKTTPSLYRPKGYTGCLEGYFRSTKERRATVIRNNRMLGRRFTHAVGINLYDPRHPALVNRDFGALTRILGRKGLIGHWTVEIDRTNVLHWHLLVVDFQGSTKALKRLLKACVAEVETFPRSRVYADKVRNQRHALDYVLKAKKPGYGDAFNPLDGTAPRRSPFRHDIYATKRVLFRPNTGLDKHGCFGNFWAEGFNERKLWALIREETATVARNYEIPAIRDFVDSLSARLGIPHARVKWAYCLNPPEHLLPSPKKDRLRVRHSRRPRLHRSSGLVATIFRRGARSRRSVPTAISVERASSVAQCGSPLPKPAAEPHNPISSRAVGATRDTRGVVGLTLARLWGAARLGGIWHFAPNVGPGP